MVEYFVLFRWAAGANQDAINKALATFGPHAEHQRVVHNFVSPIRAESLVFDREF